jgi:hypothetical protein
MNYCHTFRIADIQDQEKEDKRLAQLELVALCAPLVLNRFERFTLSQASGFAGGR